MKISLKPMFISAVFGGGLLMAGLPALAAEALPAPVQHEVNIAATPSYYTWHKRHYQYRYKGRYFNHRSRKNGFWYYY